MKNSWLIILIVMTYSWAAQAQTRLQELKKNRAYYQKKVAQANTKPNGLHLRAVNEEIVSYVVNKGYETRVDATTPSHLVVRDPHQPSKILMQLKGGDEVIVYERQGKNAFLVRTENDVVGLVHKDAFGSQLKQFPLEVLVQNFSPEEQAAREREGVIEQRMVNTPLTVD
ncbi:MAG: SH3 domain-containing protein [Aureispira sp.]